MKLILMCSFFALTACTSPTVWWKKVNAKAQHLATLEARYEILVKEHEKLKEDYYRIEHEVASLRAKEQGQGLAELNLKATGSALGRRPASISYKAPLGLKLEELQDLAFEHLREHRFAEAAVTFEEFLTKPEAASLQTADVLYSAGVAWFQVGNYNKAKEYMLEAGHFASGEQKEKVRKKVGLWQRVIDRKIASEGGGK